MEALSPAPGKFLKPEAIIAQLDVAKGCVAADFGCGPGYFSLPFAKAVGEEGKIFALDVLPQSLESVMSEAKLSGISNIETKRTNLENENGSKLEDGSVDWVIMKDVLFQNKKKDQLVKEAQRILKNGGKVLVIEWNEKDSGVGPDKEMRIAEADLQKIFENRGFRVEKKIEAGDFHYSLVLVK